MSDNNSIKELSFDLWGTLIRGNPYFRPAWIAQIQKYSPLSTEVISAAISTIKCQFDEKAEIHGEGFSSKRMFENLAENIGLQNSVHELESAYAGLFQRYPPLPAEDNLLVTIEFLSKNYRIHLNSNTMFASGDLLRSVLKLGNTAFLPYLSSLTFSDEVGFSKPSLRIFEQSYYNMSAMKEEVLHIGDNPVTDYRGACEFGFQAVLLTSDVVSASQKSVPSIQSLVEII